MQTTGVSSCVSVALVVSFGEQVGGLIRAPQDSSGPLGKLRRPVSVPRLLPRI